MPEKLWPWPGDSPVVRARKIALHYRSLAEEQQKRANDLHQLLTDTVNLKSLRLVDPDLAQALDVIVVTGGQVADAVETADRKFLEWGEEWHTPLEAEYADDEWVPTRVAARLIHIAEGTITRMRLRGRIQGKWRKDPGAANTWVFKVSDLYKLQSELRGRNWKSGPKTDSIPEQDSERE